MLLDVEKSEMIFETKFTAEITVFGSTDIMYDFRKRKEPDVTMWRTYDLISGTSTYRSATMSSADRTTGRSGVGGSDDTPSLAPSFKSLLGVWYPFPGVIVAP